MVMSSVKLRWLGLRSLKEISSGKVLLKNNRMLCFTREDQWRRLFKMKEQTIVLNHNAPPDFCCGFQLLFYSRRAVHTVSDSPRVFSEAERVL